MNFTIETKNDKVLVTSVDRDHAFAKYFYDVICEKVNLDKIGNIIMLKDGMDEIPFRTVPLLWKMGIIGTKTAIDNIINCVGVSRKEAKSMLKEASERDGRLIPLIEELRLNEDADDEGDGNLPDGMIRDKGEEDV